jgi:hypothetical protein
MEARIDDRIDEIRVDDRTIQEWIPKRRNSGIKSGK